VRIRAGEGELEFDVDGAQLVPTDLGWEERPTVVLVGETARGREALGPALARVAQVVYLDGARDAAASVDDLLAFLDALEIDRPVLLGGSVALDFAAPHPGRAARVVLVGRELDEEAEASGCPALAFGDPGELQARTDDVVAFVLEPEP
jgi:pimeloyl-ACP methyl ester carboxylesterase